MVHSGGSPWMESQGANIKSGTVKPLENYVYKGIINDCVIMQAIMRANARFGQD